MAQSRLGPPPDPEGVVHHTPRKRISRRIDRGYRSMSFLTCSGSRTLVEMTVYSTSIQALSYQPESCNLILNAMKELKFFLEDYSSGKQDKARLAFTGAGKCFIRAKDLLLASIITLHNIGTRQKEYTMEISKILSKSCDNLIIAAILIKSSK